MTHLLKSGDLAYFDSFSGLVACRVQRITGTSGPASTAQTVRFRITASGNKAYKHGDILETHGLHVVPRNAVHRIGYFFRIRVYQVQCDTGVN
jgi:hypothetical protein